MAIKVNILESLLPNVWLEIKENKLRIRKLESELDKLKFPQPKGDDGK